jgi:hypothetical protein
VSRNAVNEDWLRAHGYGPNGRGGWKKVAANPAAPIQPPLFPTPAAKVSAVNAPGKRMNKLEARYAAFLDVQKSAGILARWDFEPEKLRLADGSYYIPDFRIVWPDGSITFDETKGFWRDDARTKIKVAAALHPYRFRAVRWVQGSWSYEDFSAA